MSTTNPERDELPWREEQGLEIREQAPHLVQLRSQLLDSAQFGGNLSQGAGGIRIQAEEAPLTCLELSADRPLPPFGLFLERAQLGLRRGPTVQHLPESFDQGEVERLGHGRS